MALDRAGVPWLTPVLLAAGVAWLLLDVLTPRAIFIPPDGWMYWQASVNLLEGHGYQDFRGVPLIWWPPLYAAFLAGWQALWGVSGTALVHANKALAAVAAAGWVSLYVTTRQAEGERISRKEWPELALVLLFAALAVASTCNGVLANNLVHALVPFALASAVSLTTAASSASLLRRAAALTLLGAALMLTHNSSLTLLPPLSLSALLARGGTRTTRWAAAALVSVVPLGMWLAVRRALGLFSSHTLGWGASPLTPLEHLGTLTRSVGELLFTTWRGQHLPVLVGVLGCLGLLVARARRERGHFPAEAVPLSVTLFAAGALFLLFNLVHLENGLGRRFTLFIPLTLVPSLLALRRAAKGPRWLGALSLALAVLATVSAGYRYVESLRASRRVTPFEPAHWQEQASALAYRELTLTPGYLEGPVTEKGQQWLVPPPRVAWYERDFQRALSRNQGTAEPGPPLSATQRDEAPLP